MNKNVFRFFVKNVPIIILLSGLAACVNDDRDSTTSSGEFDTTGMMLNMTDHVILSGYDDFKTELETLNGASGSLKTYCDAIASVDEQAALDEVRADWKQAMDRWQQAELWNLGPAADNNSSLRNRIYAFAENAALSTCGADQAVVLAQQASFDISTRAVNHRGLSVLEYLLFNSDLNHTCPNQVIETQDWNSRSETQRKQWRCEYARQVSDDIQLAVESLIDAWQPQSGNYRAIFLNPQRYQESLNALSDALFYLDTDIKDLKLGVPLSINDDCSEVNCANEVESIYSRYSLHNIRNNLAGFRKLYTGGDGLGFDDLIASKGFSDINQDILADIDAAETALDSLIVGSGSGGLYALAGAINDAEDTAICANAVANPDEPSELQICNVYGLVKRISDHLKTEFVTIVNLDLPDRAQSDND